jgi:ankyrin repeat protein
LDVWGAFWKLSRSISPNNKRLTLKQPIATDGWTALHCACNKGNINIVKYLLEEQHMEKNVLINLTDQSPLHVAIVSIEGNLNVVKYLVEEHAYDIAETCSDKQTAVHLAVDRGPHLKIVKYLIDKRQADTVLAANKGYIPLHVSIIMDEFEVMEYLVGKRLDMKATDDNVDQTALHRSCQLSGSCGNDELSVEAWSQPLCCQRIAIPHCMRLLTCVLWSSS